LEHQVPAYVIFGDKSLNEISNLLPQTKEEMLQINGVGEVKFLKYGEPFLALASAVRLENEAQAKETTLTASPKKLTKTYLETLELLQKSKTIEEIATIRELAITTILSHIEVLFSHDKITLEEKMVLLEPIKIPKEIEEYIAVGLQLANPKELRYYLSLYEYLYS
jgi:ATP-dependent DNA helicase RecQ